MKSLQSVCVFSVSLHFFDPASPFSFFIHRLLEINNKYSTEALKHGQENSKNTECDTNKEVCMCADKRKLKQKSDRWHLL